MFSGRVRTLAGIWVLTCLLCASVGAEPVNLAPTPSYENPVVGVAAQGALPFEWYHFTSGLIDIELSKKHAYTGTQSVKLLTQKKADSFKGLYTEVPVTAGKAYNFSIHALNNKDDPLGGCAYIMLVIEWKDAANNELGRVEGDKFDWTLSRIRWTRLALVNNIAPDGATKGIFGLHLIEDHPGAKGSLFIDDAEITAH